MWPFHRLSLFWRIQITGWVLLHIIWLPLRFYIHGEGLRMVDSYWLLWGYYVARDLTGFVLTIGMRWLYRRPFFARLRPVHLILILFPLCLAAAIVDVLSLEPFVPQLQRHFNIHLSDSLIQTATVWLRMSLYLCWSVCYFMLRSVLESRRKERLLAESEARLREAELLMLRSQMNPHFLFNALNTIRSDAPRHSTQARVVEGLAEYLRYSLTHRGQALVPLGVEMDAMLRFLDVEQARYGDELVVEVDIDPRTRDFLVPGIFVQPLVENAIKHGRRTSKFPLHVSITTKLEDAALILVVSNTGTWVEPMAPSSRSLQDTGAGLDILHRRLALVYGERARLTVGPKDGLVVAEIQVQEALKKP